MRALREADTGMRVRGLKLFHVIVELRGGNRVYVGVTEEMIEETCDRIAHGMVRNGAPKKNEAGVYELEAFEMRDNGVYSGMFWYHDVTGWYVREQLPEPELTPDEKEMRQLSLDITRMQHRLLKKQMKDLDDAERWKE